MSVSLSRGHFDALFAPRGIVVAGAASHPGKFGFVAYHNLKACGFGGELFGTNLAGEEVLGDATFSSIADIAASDLDLVFLGVPPNAAADVMRQAADAGVRAVYCASAGYAEFDEAGRRHQEQLVALADELDMLFVGPNGQGLISTPASMCAQIVAPMPPAGSIGIASQSGGFVSSFGNLATHGGIGISRAVSVGNSAQVGVADFLEYFVDDDATDVGLAYLEHIGDAVVERIGRVAQHMPVVLLRGGTTARGARAVAVHTGSTAGSPEVDAALVESGVTLVHSVHEAYVAAATFASQPLPSGPRTLVFGTAGGWGVVTADAVELGPLELIELPTDLIAAVDERVPPRWSRGNPIDLAGGETRDTIPELLPILAADDEVDAIVYLGLGIQSNQAALARRHEFYPDHGLDRIVDFHERQDARYAQAAADASAITAKPVLTATELATSNPENPGPATVRATGRFCYPSGNDAVTALEHLWRRVQALS